MKKWIAMFLTTCLTVTAASGALALEFALGSEASEVSLIQEALLELDYYYGDITGHYGERTARGVRMFQDDHGLEVTGIADDRTRERLYLVAGVEAPPVSDTLLETNTTLRRGDAGIGVTWIQESLRELGHYDGEISGTYGLLTHEAVRLFQRAHGLSSDGVAGRNTIKAIASALEEKEAAEREQEQLWQNAYDNAYNNNYNNAYGGWATPTPEPTVDPETITTLKLGVENSAVYRLQQDLRRLGFYTGTVTGSFGRLTKEAVRLFQRAHDIPSDGVAGPVTLARIAKEIEELERAQATPTPTPVPTATPTPDPYNGLVQWITPVPAATPTPTPVPSTIVGVNSSVGFLSIERELKLYDYSEDVRQLQLALNSLGFYSSTVSAYFDLGTQASVMSYQAAKGLSVTGVADKVTLITINDDIFRRVVNSVD